MKRGVPQALVNERLREWTLGEEIFKNKGGEEFLKNKGG